MSNFQKRGPTFSVAEDFMPASNAVWNLEIWKYGAQNNENLLTENPYCHPLLCC